MKRSAPFVHSDARTARTEHAHPHGRDFEERERRRREWMIQQEREREHERLKKKKIEEWERKRRAQEEAEKKGRRRRSSSRSRSKSPSNKDVSRRRDEPQPSTSKSSVMSEKFDASSNNTRLFKGPEGTKIDVADLRRIKVDIIRNIPAAAEISNELQREIVNPEDVKVKRREGEGAKPIFERDELKKPEVPVSDVEEHRTVVALNNGREERKSHSTRKHSASPTRSSKHYNDESRPDVECGGLRTETSRNNIDRTTNYRDPKRESERDRSNRRSSERRDRSKREDSRERRSERRTTDHDTRRDRYKDRREGSRSSDRYSRRTETRPRSSREVVPNREHRDRSPIDSRDRRSRNDRSRERRVPLPHHYAETVPVPVYYESFHPRPIMVGPMMPMHGQIPMGRARMSSMMGPMRPPFPPRFIPHEMFRPSMHPNPRFGRMF